MAKKSAKVAIKTEEKEVRVVNTQTGAAKGSKTARFDLIPTIPLWELAVHYGKGCKKYAARNFQRGYPWSLSIAALMRHMVQFMSGEDFDDHKPDCPPDCTEHTGSAHLISVAWHALALRDFMIHHPEMDDREHKFYKDLKKELKRRVTDEKAPR